MKKLTAAVCAMVIAISMAGCGSGDSGSRSKNRDHSKSSAESSGEKAQAIDKLTDFAGGSDESVTLDYELKTISEGDANTDKAQVDKCVKSCIKQMEAIISNDYDAYKEAVNYDLIKEENPDIEESEVKDTFEDLLDNFESEGVTNETLNRKLSRVYLYESDAYSADGGTYGSIALVFMDENDEDGMYVDCEFEIIDGKVLAVIEEAENYSKEDIEEQDDYYDTYYDDYDTKSLLKTSNSNSKTAYNALAEVMADAETNGYSISDVFSGNCGEDWKMTAGKVYDAHNADSISEHGAKMIANSLMENGDDAGYFIIINTRINGADSYAIQWTKDLDAGVFGQYPDAISWDDYTAGGLTFGEYHD